MSFESWVRERDWVRMHVRTRHSVGRSETTSLGYPRSLQQAGG
jgi:hypothetical protein